MQNFPWSRLAPDDHMIAQKFDIVDKLPDLVIAPDGTPYIYRWHIVKRNPIGNCYFHIQTASDPARPLHDHPWDNTSVILAGGYVEVINNHPPGMFIRTYRRKAGDVIHRVAECAHRLFLPETTPYSMTLFSTGPVRREWGFWLEDGTWVHHTLLTAEQEGISRWNGKKAEQIMEGAD